MSFLTDIYSELDSEYEGTMKKEHMAAFYTILNYLELTDNGIGLTEEELKERFSKKTEFQIIIQKLKNHTVLERSSNGKYTLNREAKTFITPIFDNLMSMVYKEDKKITTKDPALNLMYNCRSQIFSS